MRRVFGAWNGTPIEEVTLESVTGARVDILSRGAAVRDMVVPGPRGAQRVVLGFDTLSHYVDHSPHFGAIAGRFANRIAHGRFTLDGHAYDLPRNQNGRHSLHGGGAGFGTRAWTVVAARTQSVTLALISPDGDAGYPGELSVLCRYDLADPATLRVRLTATCDAPTVVNLCHHSYFNLDGSADILDHALEVRANLMTPVDDDLIPNGSLAPVSETPFDFRVPRQIRHVGAGGERFWYDHTYVLRRDRREPAGGGLELAHAATLSSTRSGLAMEVWTTEPALQVYDGFKVSTPVPGLDGRPYGACAGICLEPQHVPDSPNLPHFPSTVLRPGEAYRQITEYRFRPL
jgi:aldose 1-epimerase